MKKRFKVILTVIASFVLCLAITFSGCELLSSDDSTGSSGSQNSSSEESTGGGSNSNSESESTGGSSGSNSESESTSGGSGSSTGDSTSGGSGSSTGDSTSSGSGSSTGDSTSSGGSSTGDSTSGGGSSTGDSTSSGSGSTGESTSGGSSSETESNPEVSGITLNTTSLTFKYGDSSTATLTASVTMSNGNTYSGTVSWTSNNTSIATVASSSSTTATVTPANIGTTTITATAGSMSAECSVTVSEEGSTSIITDSEGYEESLSMCWTTTNASNDTIQYKLSTESAYTTLTDSNLISEDSGEARADIVGLTAGTYDVRVIQSSTYYSTTITVDEYDRSGYAHFNYTNGVGAYNDDGTLKDNSVVIYLTDSNKNDISGSCYVYSQSNNSYTQISVTSYFPSGATCYSIGYLLNNSQYNSNGIAALSQAYGAVAIRVIGEVNAEVSNDATSSEIYGLTPYNTSDSTTGGSSGDNGRMARMKDAVNVTIEGVGEDAAIYGWGFHFISGSSDPTTDGKGYGFEVRNLTFSHYPEDALGMEGSSTSYSVERCWIHNNSFYAGYCASPAEDDKAEGDGTCDFKRGQYYTFSWNYMYNCHKTNLIGANSTNEQYNISMHHNYYDQVQSRQPLARTANIHYYNNYVYGASSYVISSRSSAYVYAEYNYFESCYNVLDQSTSLGSSDTGWGDYKGYQNVYDSCTTTGSSITPTDVSNKSDTITNSDSEHINKYIYFESSSEYIYSSYYLTSAATAKTEVIASAGANSTGDPSKNHNYSDDDDSTTSTVAFSVDDLISGGTLSSGSMSSNVTLYSDSDTTLTLLASSSSTVTTGNSAYSSYSYMLGLGGAGSSTYRSIKLDLSGAATIKVYAISSGDSARILALYDSSFTALSDTETKNAGARSESSLSTITFTTDSSGTYYIASTSGGINIYYIEIVYSS